MQQQLRDGRIAQLDGDGQQMRAELVRVVGVRLLSEGMQLSITS